MRSEQVPVKARLRWDQGTKDVLFTRTIVWNGEDTERLGTEKLFNTTQELWLWPDCGMGWGKEQPEGLTFALNVLDKFIPAPAGQVCEGWIRPLACHPLAFELMCQFRTDFLLNAPFWGGRLPGLVVVKWIETLSNWRHESVCHLSQHISD